MKKNRLDLVAEVEIDDFGITRNIEVAVNAGVPTKKHVGRVAVKARYRRRHQWRR
jgi:hypothetical protein